MDSALSSPGSRATTLVFEGYKIPIRFNGQGRPLFSVLPLCSAIGFRRSIKAVRVLVQPENLDTWMDETATERAAMPCVDERGLRKLIAASPFVRARRFGRWLPSALSEAQRTFDESTLLSGVTGGSAKAQSTGPRHPFSARPVLLDHGRSVADFAFNAFFDGLRHAPTFNPSPSPGVTVVQDIDDVVAHSPGILSRAQPRPGEAHESSQDSRIGEPSPKEFLAWAAEKTATSAPDAASASNPPCARFVLDLSDPDKPSVALLPPRKDAIDLDSDSEIEKLFASASQSQLKRVLRAVVARLV